MKTGGQKRKVNEDWRTEEYSRKGLWGKEEDK